MPRITCKTPSSGKPVQVLLPPNFNAPYDQWATLAEAPDFSVPDPTNTIPTRDPADATRAIRPGEVFFLTPLLVWNEGSSPAEVWVCLVPEGQSPVNGQILGAPLPYFPPGRFVVPPRDTITVPIQGRSLLKRSPAGQFGDRLVMFVVPNGLNQPFPPSRVHVWGSAEERIAADHVGVV